MTPPQQPLDGNAIFVDLANIEKESKDLEELEIKIQVLIAGIRHGKYSHPAATPVKNRMSCIKCFHCGKQVSTYHDNLVFRATATCPECTESGKDIGPEHEAAIIAKAREETVDAVLKDLRKNGWMVAIHNDYRQDGKYYTFWLMTSNDGRYLKGESSMERGGDISALNQIKNAIKSLSSTNEREPR